MFSRNLKEITKDQLAVLIGLFEQNAIKSSKKTNYFGYYLEDKYSEKPEIYKQAILGMGDAPDVHFILEVYVEKYYEDGNKKLCKVPQFYWCGFGDEEPYRVEKDELVETIWKIIRRDYQ